MNPPEPIVSEVEPLPPAARLLLERLPRGRRTRVVDVGANPLYPPPYAALLAAGACDLVGFEPDPEAYAALMADPTPGVTYHPAAIGDGQGRQLRLYAHSGFNSVYDPYLPGPAFHGLGGWETLRGTLDLPTTRLDDLPGLAPVDLLKIDIQGGELDALKGGEATLAQTGVVIIEQRFFPLYQGEPLFAEVDLELRRQGFRLHKFLQPTARPVASSQSHRFRRRQVRDQLIDGDCVYLRDLSRPEAIGAEELAQMCLLAASVFSSHSVVIHLLDRLVERGAAPADLAEAYVDALPAALLDPAKGPARRIRDEETELRT
ncbi:FkbM family methyltransferase [Pararhodobacter aggregans]|uniref:Methyltransferase FkbM domain-containing protein n=1 Tax=Pararhodobacter aggregans TaxID=404875 RepID=A0A2T7UUG9_9RHOB|nr:FkbM family methyltransferase [Pararhodobacter aggregans]PTX04128.1 FkbM family methyltransferase [Pararhodobacter aggregans]PVE48410.1 hypothetical protein DDE23_04920 [Pararhodobacter aggregans]